MSQKIDFKVYVEQQAIEISNLKKKLEQYQLAYDSLQHQLDDLRRHRFGKRSERFTDPDSVHLSLLDDEPTTPPPSDDDETTEVASHKRRTRKSKDTSKLPRTIEIIPVDAADKQCHCGCEKQVIRYETKELYDYQPAVFQLIEQRREVVACRHCEQSLRTAAAPAQVLPKVKATESLLAHVIVSKCHNRQPLYHLEKYGELAGLSRDTLARWMIDLREPLMPLYNLMKDRIIDYDIASLDATTLQVLNEPGRSASIKSYAYCMRGGPPDQSVVLYDYAYEAHKQFVDTWFEGFKGTVHMDADPFFHKLLADPAVLPSFCNAHARRYFEKVARQVKKPGLAQDALRFYKKLYRVEREAKQQHLSPEARYQLRKERSVPMMVQFKQWLDEHAPLTLPKSPLGKAFRYALKHWDGLTQFLDDGRVEIDNNLTEQQIKPFVIARKNFMFAASMKGAKALCLHFSLIRTALQHGLNPFQYYVNILKQLPSCRSIDDYEALLPWNITLA